MPAPGPRVHGGGRCDGSLAVVSASRENTPSISTPWPGIWPRASPGAKRCGGWVWGWPARSWLLSAWRRAGGRVTVTARSSAPAFTRRGRCEGSAPAMPPTASAPATSAVLPRRPVTAPSAAPRPTASAAPRARRASTGVAPAPATAPPVRPTAAASASTSPATRTTVERAGMSARPARAV